MTTLRDLSRHLGLSVTQVSRALNGHDDVAEDTRARVVEAARRPALPAQRLGPQARHRAARGCSALVLPDVPPPDEDAPVRADRGRPVAAPLAARPAVHPAHRRPRRTTCSTPTGGSSPGGATDGFVLLDPELRDRRARFLRDEGVPFVIHGRIEGPDDYPFYDIDNEGGGPAPDASCCSRPGTGGSPS